MSEIVKMGDYIVVQRQSYMKVHKLSPKNMECWLGQDAIDMSAVIGEPFWSRFKMESSGKAKRKYILTKCDSSEAFSDKILSSSSSGIDNRDIQDDGRSQKLSTDDIIGLKKSGMSAETIVETLIENSSTFASKTEYSQEKYLKKKEKKYLEEIVVKKPTFRIIAECIVGKAPGKALGLRMDSLAQLTTLANIRTGGVYMLYETGCQGLVSAAMLNAMGDQGYIIHVHAGHSPEKHAVQYLNLPHERMNQILTVSIASLLAKVSVKLSEQGLKDSIKNEGLLDANNGSKSCEGLEVNSVMAVTQEKNDSKGKVGVEDWIEANDLLKSQEKLSKEINERMSEVEDEHKGGKRKAEEDSDAEKKRPRWEEREEKAITLVKSRTIDGLVVVGKEHPASIVRNLLRYLHASRPFVVFFAVREPLQELFLEMKARSDVTALRLTESWLRTYQVLSDRTHPDISMTGSGGFLLSGIKVAS